jgi:hypothetical protein
VQVCVLAYAPWQALDHLAKQARLQTVIHKPDPRYGRAQPQPRPMTPEVILRDAFVLAQLLRADYLPRVWEPDEPTQELRRLSSRRASLVAERTAVKNRLHSVLAQRLLSPPVADLFGKAGRALLGALALDAEGRCQATFLSPVQRQSNFPIVRAAVSRPDDD